MNYFANRDKVFKDTKVKGDVVLRRATDKDIQKAIELYMGGNCSHELSVEVTVKGKVQLDIVCPVCGKTKA